MQRKFLNLFFMMIISAGFQIYADNVQSDQTTTHKDMQTTTQQVAEEKKQSTSEDAHAQKKRKPVVRAQVDPTILSCIAEAIIAKYCVLP